MNTTTTDTLELGQAAASQNLDRTMSSLKDGVAQATASMEQAQSAMRQGVEKAIKSATDMFSFAQGNFEAFTAVQPDLGDRHAGPHAEPDRLVQGFDRRHDADHEGVRHGQVDQGSDGPAGLAAALDAMEKAVSQTSKLTDSSMKLSEQAFAPISARLTLAAEKFGRV